MELKSRHFRHQAAVLITILLVLAACVGDDAGGGGEATPDSARDARSGAANRGLGFLLRQSSGTFDTTGTMASLVVLAAVGAIINGLVRLHQSRRSRRMRTDEHAGVAV